MNLPVLPLTTSLAIAPERLLRCVAMRAEATTWLAEGAAASGAGPQKLAVKLARTPGEEFRLAQEAERLLFVDSPGVGRLVGVGRLPVALDADGTSFAPGTAFVACEWLDGESLRAGAIDADSRRALGLAVLRDVGEALHDLHALHLCHGDVKPENVIVRRTPRDGFSARLIDLGLSDVASSTTPRGGTPRYLAPEVFEAGVTGDGRARDAWALGLTVAEVVLPELARADGPTVEQALAGLEHPVAAIVSALLARVPRLRPSAGWARRRALAALGAHEPAADVIARRRRAVKRAYLAVRRSEIVAAAAAREVELLLDGAARDWTAHAIELSRGIRDISEVLAPAGRAVVADLDAAARSRFLSKLVGPSAAWWPALGVSSDERLVQRMLELCARSEPESFVLTELEGTERVEPRGELGNPVEIALALRSGSVEAEVLDAAESLALGGAAPEALAVAIARALRLRGELGRALGVLSSVDSDAARVEAAEAARRAGDHAGARRWLAAVDADASGSADVAARARAVRARLEVDAGQPAAALKLLKDAPPLLAVLEVRALAELATGAHAAARASLERGRLLARDDEESARIEGVCGVVAHARGDAAAALSAFRAASSHAARAGAMLEEAVYFTGIAAAATDLGQLAQALEASQRAMLLFEHLDRPMEWARAALSRAAMFAAIGAVDEARDAAALTRTRAAGVDARCEAFSELALVDVLEAPEALRHARRALALLGEQPMADDLLRVSSRLMRHGAEVDVPALDELARDGNRAVDARLEWWRARVEAELLAAAPVRADLLLGELGALANVRAPATVRGPALASGAKLAARVGDGDAARRLTAAAGQAAREVLAGAPEELAPLVSALDWVGVAQSPGEGGITPEQISDVENLVRALGRRDHLRPLLDQVLDALVLWTGVERGLLLLRAPGGKLAPRAARNLAREDLDGTQLALSHSLAERALSQREPVVAVDAAGELPEVHASVHALKLRSVLAVPLIARGEALGVVYLDDRVRRGAFGPRELAWVRLVGTLAALAIADARDQLSLRRAVRKAQRAEGRLARELAEREVELEVAERELARRDARETRFSYDAIVGRSDAVRSMLRIVDRVTPSEVPVLLLGESGSGKELVARAIHENGPRAKRPFVTENCGAIPEGLLESTLFGHVRGAFTGAARPRAGLFEIAHGGTLFLDEIAEMSLGMQTKLLRVLEDGELRPVGSERARKVDVRIIGATHRDVDALVAAGRFREDLYYRLNVITIRVPPLRERASDVSLLVRHFLGVHARGRRVTVSQAALDALGKFGWPGNVRQLENEIRRALVLGDDVLDLTHLSREVVNGASGQGERSDGLNIRKRIDALEANLVRSALERTAGNQTRAAELLGLSRFGLQKMMKRLEIGGPRDKKLLDA